MKATMLLLLLLTLGVFSACAMFPDDAWVKTLRASLAAEDAANARCHGDAKCLDRVSRRFYPQFYGPTPMLPPTVFGNGLASDPNLAPDDSIQFYNVQLGQRSFTCSSISLGFIHSLNCP